MSQTENQADTPTTATPAPPVAALSGDDGHTPPEVRAALSLAAITRGSALTEKLVKKRASRAAFPAT